MMRMSPSWHVHKMMAQHYCEETWKGGGGWKMKKERKKWYDGMVVKAIQGHNYSIWGIPMLSIKVLKVMTSTPK